MGIIPMKELENGSVVHLEDITTIMVPFPERNVFTDRPVILEPVLHHPV
jgi:hypothetical protein